MDDAFRRLTIAPAGVEASGLLAALHAECFPESWGEESFSALLAAPGAAAFLAAAGAAPVGFALMRRAADEAEILTLGVVPAARRRGVAAAILAEAMARARLEGAAALHLEVADTNTPARALYAAHGFAEIGRRARYYNDGADAIACRISL